MSTTLQLTRDEAYRDALLKCGERYKGYADILFDDDLKKFIDEFIVGTKTLPIHKLNRWLGYIQGTLIAYKIVTVKTERNWTRPLFRPLDYLEES